MVLAAYPYARALSDDENVTTFPEMLYSDGSEYQAFVSSAEASNSIREINIRCIYFGFHTHHNRRSGYMRAVFIVAGGNPAQRDGPHSLNSDWRNGKYL
jgi:hypothetical protein